MKTAIKHILSITAICAVVVFAFYVAFGIYDNYYLLKKPSLVEQADINNYPKPGMVIKWAYDTTISRADIIKALEMIDCPIQDEKDRQFVNDVLDELKRLEKKEAK